MAQITRIVVATADEASKALIQRVAAQHEAGRVVSVVDSDVALVDAVAYRRPHLAFVATELSGMRGFEVADRLSRRHPGLYIAMISPRPNDVNDLRQAMKAGARECLYEPLSEQAVRRVIDEAQQVGEATVERLGPVIAVMSSKGGVGKSTIAVNLAIALKQLGAGRLALVDGDLYFGDLATLLNIKPERTIHDLNAALDAEIADKFLCKHSSGIEVLAAPLRTEQAEAISPERFRAILGVVQTLYDVVVVDVTVNALDLMLATLDVADLAIVLATLDVVCLKDVSQIVDVMNKLRFPNHNVILLGNRHDERFSLSPKDAEQAMGLRFASVIPRDDRVMLAANQGVPYILAEPSAPFTQKVRSLAKMIGDRIGRIDRVPA